MTAPRIAFCAWLAGFCGALHAQDADCPRRDVPLPARPPQIGEAPRDGTAFKVDEGYVSAILHFEREAKPGPLPQPAASIATDVTSTPLARWNYEGFLPERSPYRVTRFFRSPEGALLALSEWDYAADVGQVTLQGLDNRQVKGRPAGLFAMQAPSGCVSTTLSWKDERKLYRLELVGPFDAGRQRDEIARIGEAIAR